MKKKIAALIAFSIIALIMATACSDTSSSTDSTNSTEPSSTAAEDSKQDGDDSNDGRKMEGNMYLEGMPIVKETETFTFLVDDAGLAEDKYMIPILEEQTNVKVEWLIYPYEVAQEKKNILINSGDYPDVIGGWLLSETEILTNGMIDGLYIPIDKHIQKYSPNMSNILDMEGVRETMTLPDGHIYTIPYVLKAPLVPFNPYINQKWLEAVGMEMPTTTDELIEVLRAFKDKDPNGNGKKDEIPWSGDSFNGYLGLFAGWFGMPCPKGNFTMVDGELTFAANTESFKLAMKFFRQLNDEGLLDPEFFTQDSNQWKAKGNQNLYGVCVGYGSGDWAGEGLLPGERTDFVPLPVLKGTNVNKPVWQRDTYGSTVLRTQVAITDKADNVPVIIRWFDHLLSEEISIQINNGPFGVAIEKIGENKYRRIDTSHLSEEEKGKIEWGNLFPQSLPKFIHPDIEILPPEGTPEPYDEKALVDSMYEPYLNERIPLAWVSQEDAKRVSVLQTDIQRYIDGKIADWVSGKADIDAEWDEYKAQLEKLGLNELIEIKRKAVESSIQN